MRYWQLPAALLVLFQIDRGILMFTVGENVDITTTDFFLVSLVGARFDVMVIGYIMLPILLFMRWRQLDRWIPYYLNTANAFIFGISVIDFAHFVKFQDRVSMNTTFQSLSTAFHEKNLFLPILALLVFHFLAGYALTRISKSQNQPWSLKFQLIAILLALLGMRGSLGPHHLDLRHSEISENKSINALVIHSAYSLDQALRKRR